MDSVNGNKRQREPTEPRERFVTASEDTLEEIVKFVDDEYENKSPQHQNENQSKGRGRPTIKVKKKVLSRNNNENRNKTYGFVPRIAPRNKSPSKVNENINNDDSSPPAKMKKSVTFENENENPDSDNDLEEMEDDELEGEVFIEKDGNANELNVINETEMSKDKNTEKDTQKEETNIDNKDEHGVKYITNKKCIDCNEMYCDYKNNKTKRICRICKCKEHGCRMAADYAASKGDTWLCGECLKLTNIVEKRYPDLFEKLRLTLKRKNTKRKKTRNNKNSSPSKKNEDEDLQIKNKDNHTAPLNRFDIVFNEEDLKSLDEGEWVSDSIIAFWFKFLEEVVYKNNQDILFIPPSVTQALKEGLTEDFDMLLKPLLSGKKYILMAVNDNKLEKVGGQHWTLLVHNISENLWYHYDSLKNHNLKEAQTLAGRLQEYLQPGTTPSLIAADCAQQENNIDCGAYTMINADIIAWILAGEVYSIKSISKFSVVKQDIRNIRNKIRKIINVDEISNETIRNINKNDPFPRDFNGFGVDNPEVELIPDIQQLPQMQKIDKNNETIKKTTKTDIDLTNVKRYPNINKDKICPFLTRGKCRYGAKGENNLGKCNKYHPNQCKDYNLNGSTTNGCQKGQKCNNWHATYICRLSANSNECYRIDCNFKHHKNCSVIRNDHNDFLSNHQMPNQHQPPLHQHHHRYHYQNPHQQQHQHTKRDYGWPVRNRSQPIQQLQHNNKQHQVSEDRLRYLIRSIVQEERNNNYYY